MTVPSSTYRLQFRNGMTFDRAEALVPYWTDLGISHLYASPIFSAVSDSTHGYDVIDPNVIDPVLGGRAGFDRLSQALRAAGIGLILDIVPNHMAASLENPWWFDVLAEGRASRYARQFDIDWSQRITLPLLGDDFAAAVEANELVLRLDPQQGSLGLAYFENDIPLMPSTYALALGDLDDPLATAIVAAASGDRGSLRKNMVALLSDAAAVERLQEKLKDHSRDDTLLEALHEGQAWRLICWRQAAKALSYRRFFEVTGLVGLRVEDEAVFADAHRLTLELVRNGQVDGLRLDHVDGLADPKTYLQRLRDAVGPQTFLLVEKILARGERLPGDWPIAGTTGYEFIAALGDVFVDHSNSGQLDAIYAGIDPQHADVEPAQADAKRLMIDVNFEGEVATLVELAGQILEREALQPADGSQALRQSLRDILVAFPVYRTYGTGDGLTDADQTLLAKVIDNARLAGDHAVLDGLHRILLGTVAADCTAEAALFRRKFQQLSGPVMAKAVEDTLFFRSGRMLALNEVGGELDFDYGSVDRFHAHMAERVKTQPAGLTATSTHDTKRGEDARARLFTITEAPMQWASAVQRWRQMHAALVRSLPAGPAPEPGTEWMLYQSLAGVWPPELTVTDRAGLAALETRFLAFLEKSTREAKLRSNWTAVDAEYELAVSDYARRLLSADNAGFLEDFSRTLRPFQSAGLINSLSQTLLKLTAPGIPDIYQGAEGLDFSLVDPDNRRLPDFGQLAHQLARAEPASMDAGALESGRLKQQVTATVLRLRRQIPALFADGTYTPLAAQGEQARHVVAFARSRGDTSLVVIVPRLVFDWIDADGKFFASEVWGKTSVTLPPSQTPWKNLFTQQRVQESGAMALSEVLTDLPFAVLINSVTSIDGTG